MHYQLEYGLQKCQHHFASIYLWLNRQKNHVLYFTWLNLDKQIFFKISRWSIKFWLSSIIDMHNILADMKKYYSCLVNSISEKKKKKLLIIVNNFCNYQSYWLPRNKCRNTKQTDDIGNSMKQLWKSVFTLHSIFFLRREFLENFKR